MNLCPFILWSMSEVRLMLDEKAWLILLVLPKGAQ